MDYLSDLNDVQRKIVTDTEGACLVLAGAGSGKTRVLTYRIAYLLRELQVSPYNILAITFTNKATREMKERVERISERASEVWVSTFHSFCVKVLRVHVSKLGFTSDFTIYTDKESNDVVKQLLSERNITDNAKIKSIRSTISACKNEGGDVERYCNLHCVQHEALFREVYSGYATVLKQSNALDFDDLLLATLYLFDNFPEVLSYYAERFKYVLVDEYQDTNMPQYMIIRRLSSVWGNLFVVGDEDQSIYGWRGADINNILHFKQDFKGAKVYKLEENYRSTRYILDCANRLIEHNKSRLGKRLFTEREGGLPVKMRECRGDREECEYVAETIYGLVHSEGYKYSDIAVLVRKNAFSQPIENRFAIEGIPCRIVGGIRFYDKKEIKDVMAYLTLLVNPRDDVAFRRICNTPARGISDVTVARLTQFAESRYICLSEACNRIDEIEDLRAQAKNAVTAFASMMNGLRARIQTTGLIEIINETLTKSGYLDALKRESQKDREEEDRVANVYAFIASAKDYLIDNEDSGLAEFLQSLSLYSDLDADTENDRVVISTIHLAKGLEFKVVFLIALENENFPVLGAMNDPDEMEEERRVAYVAITRAMERLYLSWCTSRFVFNKYNNYTRSIFVAEMLGLERKTVGGSARSTGGAKPGDKTSYADKKNIYPAQPSGAQPGGATSSTSKFALPSGGAQSRDKDISAFRDGVKVKHPIFGEGVIVQVRGDAASIAFQGRGVVTFNLRIAPLTVIS